MGYLDEKGLAHLWSKVKSLSIGGDSLPKGVIVIWSGAAGAVPDGWALCDGKNGTPDLRGRFVVCADSNGTVYSFSSNNQNQSNSTASIVLTAKKDITGITLTYDVQSESNFDKLSFWRGNTQGSTLVGSYISGNPVIGTLEFGNLTTGQTMEFKYEKDGSNSTGSDTATVYGITFTSGGAAVSLSEGNLAEYFNLSYPDSYRFLAGTSAPAASTYPVAKTGGEAIHTLTASEMPSHWHNEKMPKNDSWSGLTDVIGTMEAEQSSVTRTFMSTKSVATKKQVAVVYTGSTGGGQAHNNMPPYYALCYIMKL